MLVFGKKTSQKHFEMDNKISPVEINLCKNLMNVFIHEYVM